jgi:hypothetical protein
MDGLDCTYCVGSRRQRYVHVLSKLENARVIRIMRILLFIRVKFPTCLRRSRGPQQPFPYLVRILTVVRIVSIVYYMAFTTLAVVVGSTVVSCVARIPHTKDRARYIIRGATVARCSIMVELVPARSSPYTCKIVHLVSTTRETLVLPNGHDSARRYIQKHSHCTSCTSCTSVDTFNLYNEKTTDGRGRHCRARSDQIDQMYSSTWGPRLKFVHADQNQRKVLQYTSAQKRASK